MAAAAEVMDWESGTAEASGISDLVVHTAPRLGSSFGTDDHNMQVCTGSRAAGESDLVVHTAPRAGDSSGTDGDYVNGSDAEKGAYV